MNGLNYTNLFLLCTGFALLFVSCEKDTNANLLQQGAVRTDEQLLKDSVYYYYNLYSLWGGESIPESKQVHRFTDAYDSPRQVLDALKARTPFHAAYGGSIDRFSYLEQGKEGDPAHPNSEMNTGFGLFLTIGAVSDAVAYPVVYFVEGGSFAQKNGIQRSDIVLEINDELDLSIPVSCANGNCKIVDESTYQTVVNALLSAMSLQSMRLKIRKRNQQESEVLLTAGPYAIDPIIKESVFSSPGKKIGYLALSSFEEVSKGHVNRSNLDRVFAGFEQQEITDLILDLRYNSGGYVRTAEYLSNKIISAKHDGELMYKYAMNTYLASPANGFKERFEDVYFQRENRLNLETVYFLVTDLTASSAELLIHVLRPYMQVVLIAENEGTYGKPVGFFEQEIMGKATLWAASFKLINARGETDYWEGIRADKRNVVDYVFRDFGDPEETMLAAALAQATGTRRIPEGAIRSLRNPFSKGAKRGMLPQIPKMEVLKLN